MNQRSQLAPLQKEYRRAWNHLIVEVESLQSLVKTENPESDAVVEQRVRVDMAAARYRKARNELAEHLLECGLSIENHLTATPVHSA